MDGFSASSLTIVRQYELLGLARQLIICAGRRTTEHLALMRQ